MTNIQTNKTVQTENVSNGKVILKGCISGQKLTRLSKQAQWRIFRQLRVSEENYFDQFSWIKCSKLRIGKHIFLGENLTDICKQHDFFFYPLIAHLDIGAGVQQPFDCLIVQNRQAV